MRPTRFAVRGLAVAAALTLALAACDEDEVVLPPEVRVTVMPSLHTMKVGEQVTLHASVSGTENRTVTWESNAPSVATVDRSSGVVTAVGAGTAVIIAKSVVDTTAQGAATIVVVEEPASTIEVTVVPGEVAVPVGATRQLVAQVSGTTNQNVTWSSDDESVATVSNTGLVTGVAEGTTLIRAASEADPQAVGVAVVNVVRITGEIVIKSITLPDGTQANPNNLSGQVGVTVEFTAPQGSGISRVEVAVRNGDGNEDVVCSQSIGGTGADAGEEADALAQIVCPLLTDAYGVGDGGVQVRFPNGQYTLVARLVTSADVVNAQADQTVTFNNADAWVLNVEPAKGPVADDDGAAWYGGDVVVTGWPVPYSGRKVSGVTFRFFGVNKAGAADGDGGFSATYSATADIPGEHRGEVDAVTAVLSAVYEGGQNAPTAVRAWQLDGETVIDDPADDFELRLDNEPPVANFALTAATTAGNALENLCCMGGWVGAAYEFAAGWTGVSDTGVGVDGDPVFYWGEASQTAAQIKAAGRVVEKGADIPETQTNTEVKVIAVVADRLGNETIAEVGPLGVDHGKPTLGEPTGPADGAIFTTVADRTWSFATFTDALSGFSANDRGLATLLRNFEPGPGNCVVGGFAGGACVPLVVGDRVELPASAGEGYFTMSYSLRDRAGNTTAPEERTILVDATAPTINGSVVFPTTLTGGEPAVFGIGSISDNVDLGAFDVVFEFAGGFMLPMGPWKVVGDGFGGDLVTEVRNETYEVSSFIRSIQVTDLRSDAPVPASSASTAVGFRARDVAGNRVRSATVPFAAGTVPAGEDVSSYAPDLQTFHVEVSDPIIICDIEIDGDCGTTPESTTISAIVTGPSSSSFTNPYARVWFFRVVDLIAQTYEFIGEATSADMNESGPNRTYTYRITLNGAGLGEQRGMGVFAVAITRDGDALAAQPKSIDVVR